MKEKTDVTEGANRLKEVGFSDIRKMLDRTAVLREEGKDVISLCAGEPDFATPESIKQAAIQALEENYTHYGSNRGYLPLRRKIAAKIQEETGTFYDPETEILVTCGGTEALNNAILSVINPGDEVIILSPAFVNYQNLVRLCGGTAIMLTLSLPNGFLPELDRLEEAITDQTKMIILNNPNNPTGAVYPREIIEGICALAVKYHLLILSDEMYSSLVYEGEFVSVASVPGMKERTILVHGFSKTYAMTGWRMGYLAANRQLMSHILKVHQYSTTCCPTFLQVGMARAMDLEETRTEVNHMIAEFRERRELLVKELDKIPQLIYKKPSGAFYCTVDVSGTGLTGQEFAEKLLEKTDTAVVPVAGMGVEQELRFLIRISFAASEREIREGMKRVRNFVEMVDKSKTGA